MVVVVKFQLLLGGGSTVVVERKARGDCRGACRVSAAFDHCVEVRLTEQSIVSALAELITGDQLTLADDALEALDVVDVVSGPHHQVVLGERHTALGAPGTEQPDHPPTVNVIGCLHDRANIEQTSSWLKQAYWNPAPGSNVGLGVGS